jgi:hypothetical protein
MPIQELEALAVVVAEALAALAVLLEQVDLQIQVVAAVVVILRVLPHLEALA